MLSAMKLIIFCLTRYVMPLIAVVSDSLASQCLGWHWGGNSFLFRWVEVMCLLSYAAVSHSAVCYYAQRTQSREEHRSDA